MLKAALFSLCLVPGVAFAQSSATELATQAAGDLAAAFLSLRDADDSEDRVAALTETIRAYEDGLTAYRDALRHVAIRERALEKDFDSKRDRVERMLAVMQTMQASGAPLLLLHPTGPIGTARAGMILTEVTPALQAQALSLKVELQEVAGLRKVRQDALTQLELGLTGVQSARTKLGQAISARTDLPRRLVEDKTQLSNLVKSARSLEAFANTLSDSELADETRFADARGTLALPVQGQLLRRFDEADAAGIRRPGVLLATRPRALVTTPWPATIRYAGPLLDYGNVMILEPAGGYLLVMAGLAEVYGEAGEVVPSDAPLGLMGGQTPNPDTFATATVEGSGGARTETLYIEVRVGEGPVDPSLWFALNKD